MKDLFRLFFFSALVFLFLQTQIMMGGIPKLDSRIISANTNFGFNLYRKLVESSTDSNRLISPTSIAWCLTMAYSGANQETARAMARGLEIAGIPPEALNAAYAQLNASLNQPASKIELEVANSLWARRGVAFRPEFLQTNRDYYGAQLSQLNFDDPRAVGTINSWISNATRGKIDRIIDQIDSNSILFLINAIYFKGKWSTEFDPAKTVNSDFFNAAGTGRPHPLMRRAGTFNYLEGNHFQAVNLPYGDGRVSMYVFLPAKDSSLTSFQNKLTTANWNAWMGAFQPAEGDLGLPRFKMQWEATLNDSLKALGMQAAFDPNQADFSRMIDGRSQTAFISKVKHKTFAEVNEEGTEAAAATSTEIQIVSMIVPRKKFQMIVNRPFFFAIRDNVTGLILFMGSVSDPVGI